MPVALQRVLVDLPDRRVVRPQVRRQTFRHLGIAQPFGNLLPRPVDVDVVLERQDHLRQPERRDRPLDQHARRSGQRALDRDRHLLLDLLRRLAGVEGDHHDLDVGHVRERLDLQLGEGDGAEHREQERRRQRDGAPVDGEVDELVEHGGAESARRCASLPLALAPDMPGGHVRKLRTYARLRGTTERNL
jgi:hypothetical protein